MDIAGLPDHPFTLRDADRYDVTPRQIERAARSRLIRRVTRGVYVRSDVPDSLEVRACAVSLVVSPHHVAVNRTAAWLHGADVLVRGEHDVVPPIETCALRGRNPTRRREIDGRTRDLLPREVMRLGPVRVTTPLRTALDLGCELRRREAFAALTTLARQHGFGIDEPGRRACPGSVADAAWCSAASLVPLVDPRLESPREAWTLLTLLDAGLPLPEIQWWVDRDDRPTYRLDLAYVDARIAIEYDGRAAHDTATQQAHDRERREWLREMGWEVVIVRQGDFTGAALDRWVRRVERALTPSYTNRRW
ncbi:DUF559 domain-containing protein [Nocardioides sp. W3-2-3]|uniref:DUF559 domain-containing protein n=1 Tax=Nocardioides convexus TaxID=2712224 RepID=UPI002418A7AA|nr:DUF559 domain-containing protein [Nocardioides convexus]NGZ99827.1 DUF559 domain-containing protein [Nocardioides convexus]